MAHFRQMTIPVFVPHLGCPHDCVFCNQKKITGCVETELLDTDALIEHVNRHLTLGGDSFNHVEIGFFGGSFTGIESSAQEMFLSVAKKFKDEGRIQGIRLSTRPDLINEVIIERLVQYGVTAVELGVQSFDDTVLVASGRGHSSDCVIKAVNALKATGIEVGIQLMLGLPGDTQEIFLTSVRQAIALQPVTMRLYPTLVIKETALENLYNEGFYKPLNIETAVEWATDALLLIEASGIKIIRMGLQATETLNHSESLIAGPWHPAFRSLVEAELFKRLLIQCMVTNKFEGLEKPIKLLVNKKQLSSGAGHHRSNLNYLEANGYTHVKLIGDPHQEVFTIKIDETQEMIGRGDLCT